MAEAFKGTKNWDNLQHAFYAADNPYGIPTVRAYVEQEDKPLPEDWIGFDSSTACPFEERKHLGVHFFENDHRFVRVWKDPDRYAKFLATFSAVIMADFSVYTDYPLALQMWNAYRNHWLGRYWTEYGVRVIPHIIWGDESTYDFCFAGYQQGGTVCVSSVGTQLHKDTKDAFLRGWNEMMKRIRPDRILFHGTVPKGLEGNIIKMPSFIDELRERAGHRNKKKGAEDDED